MFTRTQAILAFKTAIMKQLSDTEGCFLPFLSLYSLFLCHPTLLIITINPSRCLFVSLFSQPISFRLSFSLSPPPERLFVCISNILNERVLFCSTGRDCLQACCVHKLCVCVYARACMHVRNSSAWQRGNEFLSKAATHNSLQINF